MSISNSFSSIFDNTTTDIFERSVDPLNSNIPIEFQIFENTRDCHDFQCSTTAKCDNKTPSSLLIENFIPACLDATTEILSNSKVDLNSVNVLSTRGKKRKLSRTRHRNSSISKKISDFYFNNLTNDSKEITVPFYSYVDMINAENSLRSNSVLSSSTTIPDEATTTADDSNIDNYFLEDDNVSEKSINDDDDVILRVCSMQELLKCKSNELRGV